MPKTTFEVLGVYRPDIPAQVYEVQLQVTGDETREHFEGLVLIEALLDDPEGIFKPGQTGQPYHGHFQCMYDEALLSADGQSLIRRDIKCLESAGPLRFAFYLHYYDPSRLLEWSKGQIECPPIQPIPERLKLLVPYNPTD